MVKDEQIVIITLLIKYAKLNKSMQCFFHLNMCQAVWSEYSPLNHLIVLSLLWGRYHCHHLFPVGTNEAGEEDNPFRPHSLNRI